MANLTGSEIKRPPNEIAGVILVFISLGQESIVQ